MRNLQVSEEGADDMVIMKEASTVEASVMKLATPEGGKREGGLGNRPSYTWRSLLAGREVLKMGLHKSIGNGESTSIWGYPWIPGVQASTLTPMHDSVWRPEKVSELLDPSINQWDIIKLWSLFDTNICQKNMCIPTTRMDCADQWAWSGEVNGNFTVKSCYRLAMEETWSQNSLTPELFCEVPPTERCWDECNAVVPVKNSDRDVPASLKWLKPSEPFIKMNVDIAMKNSGEGSAGGVFRDHEGMCVGAFSSSIPAMMDVALMEAIGIKKGIEVAREGRITHLVIESDSKLVVDMLYSSCTHMSRLSNICRSILELCSQFDECEIRWVPRSCNSSADCMARAALSFPGDKVWPDSIPIWLSKTCIADLN
ncbi:reverse transcriptase [Senna tora]|uniref:Reverse transcriptase n=1 Tax=Senna tora TaxID=362788 RepID=A0A834W5T0_9FABA|nr:reverse transcriptase [Senna tora]